MVAAEVSVRLEPRRVKDLTDKEEPK